MDARKLVPIAQEAMFAAAEKINAAIEEQAIDDKFTIVITIKRKKGEWPTGDIEVKT